MNSSPAEHRAAWIQLSSVSCYEGPLVINRLLRRTAAHQLATQKDCCSSIGCSEGPLLIRQMLPKTDTHQSDATNHCYSSVGCYEGSLQVLPKLLWLSDWKNADEIVADVRLGRLGCRGCLDCLDLFTGLQRLS